MITLFLLIIIYFVFQVTIWTTMKKRHSDGKPSVAEAASCILASLIGTILIYVFVF